MSLLNLHMQLCSRVSQIILQIVIDSQTKRANTMSCEHLNACDMQLLICTHTKPYNPPTTLTLCKPTLSPTDSLSTPSPIQVTEAASPRLQYQVSQEFNSTARNYIGGLHVTRFGVPMVVVYTHVSASRPVVVVQDVVPGAQYNIAVWGVSEDNMSRSREPGRQTTAVEERSKFDETGHLSIWGRGLGDKYICVHLYERCYYGYMQSRQVFKTAI